MRTSTSGPRVLLATATLSYIAYIKLSIHFEPQGTPLSPLGILAISFSSSSLSIRVLGLALASSSPFTSPTKQAVSDATQFLLSGPDSFQRANPLISLSCVTTSFIAVMSLALSCKKAIWKLLNKQSSPFPVRKTQLLALYSSSLITAFDTISCAPHRAPLNTFLLFFLSTCLLAAPSFWWRDSGIKGDTAGALLLLVNGVVLFATFITTNTRLGRIMASFVFLLVLRGVETLSGFYWMTSLARRINDSVLRPALQVSDDVLVTAATGIYSLVSSLVSRCVELFSLVGGILDPVREFFLEVFVNQALASIKSLRRPALMTADFIHAAVRVSLRSIQSVLTPPINLGAAVIRKTTDFIISNIIAPSFNLTLTVISRTASRVLIPSFNTVTKIVPFILTAVLRPITSWTILRVNFITTEIARPLLVAFVTTLRPIPRVILASVFKPLVVPFMAFISAAEFYRHGMQHLQTSNFDIIGCLPFAFASILTAAVGLTLLGRRCATRADYLARSRLNILAPLLAATGRTLESIGVFAYSHADLGTIDLAILLYSFVSPVLCTTTSVIFNACHAMIVGVYNFVATAVNSSARAIWDAAQKIALTAKKTLKIIFKAVGRIVSIVWTRPWMGLVFSFTLLYSTARFQQYFPNFHLGEECMTHLSSASAAGARHTKTVLDLLASFSRCIPSVRVPQMAISMKLHAWRWFRSRTFAATTSLVHLTLSRALRFTWAYDRGREFRAGAVERFGAMGIKTLTVPVVLLSSISKGGGDFFLSFVEWAAAPFTCVYLVVFTWGVIKVGREWTGTEDELRELRRLTRRVIVKDPKAPSPRSKSIAPFDAGRSEATVITVDACVSCLEDVSPYALTVLVCGHACLCKQCLEHWVELKKRDACCPCCRQNLYAAM